jgi:soluble lytic murein transglycosylase-like protein
MRPRGEPAGAVHVEAQEGLEATPAPEGGPLPKWLWTITEDIAFEHGLSPKLIQSIILMESNGNPHKVSPRGAKGLMQLMPGVMEEYKVTDPYDPAANIRAGVQYLGSLLQEFSGDLSMALAAYNAGPTAVRKYRGIPPFPETQAYVQKVNALFYSSEVPPRLPEPLSEVAKPGALDRLLAKIVLQATPRNLTQFLKKMWAERREDETL